MIQLRDRRGVQPASYEAVLQSQARVLSVILRQADRPDVARGIPAIHGTPQLEICGDVVHSYIVTLNWSSLSNSLLNKYLD